MKIDIQVDAISPTCDVRVGNVYSVKGGIGESQGHMNVIIAIIEPKDPYTVSRVIMLTVDKEGNPVGACWYGVQYVQELIHMALLS